MEDGENRGIFIDRQQGEGRTSGREGDGGVYLMKLHHNNLGTAAAIANNRRAEMEGRGGGTFATGTYEGATRKNSKPARPGHCCQSKLKLFALECDPTAAD
jgi:hypothetical protein